MPGTDPTVPSDWLARAELDFEAAEILLTQAPPVRAGQVFLSFRRRRNLLACESEIPPSSE